MIKNSKALKSVPSSFRCCDNISNHCHCDVVEEDEESDRCRHPPIRSCARGINCYVRFVSRGYFSQD